MFRGTKGVKAFGLIWAGQVISAVGSGLTSFGLSVWVFQTTGSVTQFAQVPLFTVLPRILLAPFAGLAADRYSRVALMILSDLGAAAGTLVLVALLVPGALEIWHIYLVVFLTSVITAFRFPAYKSSIPLLVPKSSFGRANGMSQFGQAGAGIVAPFFAGFLLAAIELEGVLIIDVGTFLVSVLLLSMVRIPRPGAVAETGQAGEQSSAKARLAEALRYVRERPGLVRILIYYAVINLIMGIGGVLLTPLVLTFGTPAQLGTIVSAGGLGLLAGSLFMSVTGGPRVRALGILSAGGLVGISMMLAGLRPSVGLVAAAAFLLSFALPVLSACTETIFQSKVPNELQGRVFALVRMVVQSTSPIAFLLAGPLADQLFRPLMAPGGLLAGSLEALLGAGEGRGIGLMYVVVGIVPLLATAWGVLSPRLRLLEREIPDAVGMMEGKSPDAAPEVAT